MPIPRRLGRSLLAAPLLAGLLTGVVHTVVMVAAGIYPFGNRTRGQGDYITQYLAFHAEFRRMLLGDPLTSWQFTWARGAGVPFLNDYANYVGGPFPFMLVLFGERHVELGIMVMVVAKLVVAALVMATLLQRMSASPACSGWRVPVIAMLATGYASSSWVFDSGMYTVMWLDGVIAFPLLCLVALSSVRGGKLVWGALGVALAYWSNYYTAWMATLGSVVFVLVVLIAHEVRLRDAVRAVGRFAVRGMLGVALVGILLVPQVIGLRGGSPSDGVTLGSYPWSWAAAKLLPGTEGIANSPGIFAGSLSLLLASGVLVAAVPLRQRLAWGLSLVVLLATMQLRPVLLAWHAFSSPHGNPYRFSFVVCGWIALTAWVAVGGTAGQVSWPRLRQVALAATVLGFIVVAAQTVPFGPSSRVYVSKTLWLLPVAVVLVLGLGTWGRRWARVVAMVLLVGLTVGEAAANGVFTYENTRMYLASSKPFSTVGRTSLPAARGATEAAEWPTYRVGSTQPQILDHTFYVESNHGARDGFPGVAYYSSLMPAATQEAFRSLSMPWSAHGRMLTDRPDPVADALFAVAARPTPTGVVTSPALPLVRLLPGGDARAAAGFAARNALLPRPVYSRPVVTVDGVPLPDRETSRLGKKGAEVIGVRCPAGTRVAVDSARLPGASLLVRGKALFGSDAVALGVVHLDGPTADLTPKPGAAQLPASSAFACLSAAELRTVIQETEVPRIAVGPGTVSARFAAPVTGRVLIATASNDGWACVGDGRSLPASKQGFLSLPVREVSSVSCSYTVPGLRAGMAVSAAAALVLVGITVAGRLRRSATSDASEEVPSAKPHESRLD